MIAGAKEVLAEQKCLNLLMDAQSNAQFVEDKTKYEDTVAAFNTSQKILVKLEMQLAILRCKDLGVQSAGKHRGCTFTY